MENKPKEMHCENNRQGAKRDIGRKRSDTTAVTDCGVLGK